MKYLSGYTDPFLSPVTGSLSSPQDLSNLTRGYTWMGDENNKPIETFKLIDLKIDIQSLFSQTKYLFNSGFVIGSSDPKYPQAQSLGALTTGLLKNTVTDGSGVLSAAAPNVDYMAGISASVPNALVAFTNTDGKTIEMAGGDTLPITCDGLGGLYAATMTLTNISPFLSMSFKAPPLNDGTTMYWPISGYTLTPSSQTLALMIDSYNPLTGSIQTIWGVAPKGDKGDKGDDGTCYCDDSGSGLDGLFGLAGLAGLLGALPALASIGELAGGLGAIAAAGALAGALGGFAGNELANALNGDTPGRDGIDGQDGQPGRDGQDGQDGVNGRDGQDGRDGMDGRDGQGLDPDGNLDANEIDANGVNLRNPDDPSGASDLNISANEINGSDLSINAENVNASNSISAPNIQGNDFEIIDRSSGNYVNMRAPSGMNDSYDLQFPYHEARLPSSVPAIPNLNQLREPFLSTFRSLPPPSQRSKNSDDLPESTMNWGTLYVQDPLGIESFIDEVTGQDQLVLTFNGSSSVSFDAQTLADIVYGTLTNLNGTFGGVASLKKNTDFYIKSSYLPSSDSAVSSLSLLNRYNNGYRLITDYGASFKTFVLQDIENGVTKDLLTFTGTSFNVNGYQIDGAPLPLSDNQLASKKYVDSKVGGGSVTSITAGQGLAGGTITTTGTISLPNLSPSPAGTYPFADVTVNAMGLVTSVARGSPTSTTPSAIAVWGSGSGSSLLNTSVTIDSSGDLTSGGTGSFGDLTVQVGGELTFQTSSVNYTAIRANPSATGGNTLTLPVSNAWGIMLNNGTGGLSWGPSSAYGYLRNDGSGNLNWGSSGIDSFIFNGNTIECTETTGPFQILTNYPVTDEIDLYASTSVFGRSDSSHNRLIYNSSTKALKLETLAITNVLTLDPNGLNTSGASNDPYVAVLGGMHVSGILNVSFGVNTGNCGLLISPHSGTLPLIPFNSGFLYVQEGKIYFLNSSGSHYIAG